MAKVQVTLHGNVTDNADGSITFTGTLETPDATNPIAPPGPSTGPTPPSGGSPGHPTAPPGVTPSKK